MSTAIHGPWPEENCLRANMILSISGASEHEGASAPLSGPLDNRLLHELRASADLVMVGAATAIAERYIGVRLPADLAAERTRRGKPEPPPLAVLTRSARLPGDARFLSETDVRNMLVVTGDDPAASARGAKLVAGHRCDLLDATGWTMTQVISELHNRGYARILCEGGPRLLDLLIAEDLVDDLLISLSPVYSSSATGTRRFALATTTARDGFVFTRWVRHDRSSIH
ncbi:dihydrofolate reductase family protein [Gordonia paraffinivorans]|uniref:dihydrofolate reductase family protein n=1 Tax=Gordonia paraffinivorans TaxID=175628 RepID=UPI001444A092|nr:dihydrofolate reductase family protein [Gordonia paraffinivorans]